jgi:hypothetical protein
MRVRLAIGLGLLVIVGSLVAVLSKSEQRLAATNSFVRVSGADVPISGDRRCPRTRPPRGALPPLVPRRDSLCGRRGRRAARRKGACQAESIPAETVSLRVYAGVPAGRTGPLDVTIREGGRIVSRATFGVVRDGRPATAELSPPVPQEIVPAEVCFRNRGRATVRLAGNRTALKFGGANPYGLEFGDQPRIDYLRPGEESGWALAGTVADRFGRVKASFFGSWTMWAVFGLVGLSWAAAVVLMLRRLPAR